MRDRRSCGASLLSDYLGFYFLLSTYGVVFVLLKLILGCTATVTVRSHSCRWLCAIPDLGLSILHTVHSTQYLIYRVIEQN